MNKFTSKKTILFMVIAILAIFSFFEVFQAHHQSNLKTIVNVTVNAEHSGEYKLYYTSTKNKWSEQQIVSKNYDANKGQKKLEFYIPANTKQIRLDPGVAIGNVELKNLFVQVNNIQQIDFKKAVLASQQIRVLQKSTDTLMLQATNTDPGIYMDIEAANQLANQGENLMFKVSSIILSILFGFLFSYTVVNVKSALRFLKYSIDDRKLIWSLSKNDFKTKYAASYLGVVWGFIQPLLTIVTYWFVFQVGLRSGDVADVPFILWFLVAIIPWFFFSDGIGGATSSFFDYSYLVKKVVFRIEVIPSVKIMSALYVHLFFIVFIFIVYAAYGYTPQLFNLQFIYYTGCMIVLVAAITIFTSATVLFFRDLNQIIGIVLQMGFWFTPIGWPSTMLSPFWLNIFKLNPMYYVVDGYRDSFINKVWFFEHPYHTIYFWLFCLVTLVFGVKIFNRLRTHFSDVL
ncbi:ABC transporter permease [Paenibacillus sp. WLX2291]|uniref:ABC transporter permease n=1 Tax=Paenibacillus sp. WLX2291 TaxID=3296934 RepID=UPI0039842D67